MKEADYINATNLTKLRLAQHILRDVLTTNAEEEGRIGGLVANITQWIIDLEKKM